ncbi:hypothetical protein DAEQUDRAFT_446822 [Daedalea quercina L-15889]|uniref:F-box domain-containing protein n=1 Tax=Daedalea quercina L-15889 TaxID=1314783 RepID=A0A165N585_9APHY|nr:hypothetical protein DAEQUDRAFT_446822 [Daedalea quercina L-15889]
MPFARSAASPLLRSAAVYRARSALCGLTPADHRKEPSIKCVRSGRSGRSSMRRLLKSPYAVSPNELAASGYARTRTSTNNGIQYATCLPRELWDPAYENADADAPARKEWLRRLQRVERNLGRGGSTPVRPCTSGELPLDIWERVLNGFLDDPRTLFICARVCRAWYALASRHLPRIGDTWALAGRADVMRVARVFGREYPSAKAQRKWRAVVLEGSGVARSLAHARTFAAALAKQLCRIDELEIHNGVWTPGAADASTFVRITTCIALSTLTLRNVVFPSTTAVAKLICSLPNLSRLSIIDVNTNDKRRGHTFCLPHDRPRQLRWVQFDCSGLDDVVQFMAYAGITSTVTQAVLVIRAAQQADVFSVDMTGYPAFLRDAISLEKLTVELRDSDSHNAGLMHGLSFVTNCELKEVHFVVYQKLHLELVFRDCNIALLSSMMPRNLHRINIRFVANKEREQSSGVTLYNQQQLGLMRDNLHLDELDAVLSSPRFAALGHRLIVTISLGSAWRVKDSFAVWREQVERGLTRTRRIHLLLVWIET